MRLQYLGDLERRKLLVLEDLVVTGLLGL